MNRKGKFIKVMFLNFYGNIRFCLLLFLDLCADKDVPVAPLRRADSTLLVLPLSDRIKIFILC